MKYILVQHRQILLLGPVMWQPRFIQSELDDLGVAFVVPPTESGYIKINDDYEIFPVTESKVPEYNTTFETLAGPFFTYGKNSAVEYYNKIDLDISSVQQNLKSSAAALRYQRVQAGTNVDIGKVSVNLATDLESRTHYMHLLSTIGDTTVDWKFAEGFISLTKSDVELIVQTIHDYIQAQFSWEKTTVDNIMSAKSIAELQALEIK